MGNDSIHKEIDLIQACISRMANNSFLLKGWTISILVVVLALVEKQIDPIYLCLILMIPFVSFWYLDAFFLRTEKMYRKMYEWVIENRRKGNEQYLYDLNPKRFEEKVQGVLRIMFTQTLVCFYLIPILINVCILIYLIKAR